MAKQSRIQSLAGELVDVRKELELDVDAVRTRLTSVEQAVTTAQFSAADATRQATGFLNEQINLERIHRLKLADEQRIAILDLLVQERKTAQASAVRLAASVAELRDRGFFGRLRWLLVGR